jgi:hypothetical protein
MNNPKEHPTLEDVLDAFVASGADPYGGSLAGWIQRYPEYTDELTEFAANWSLVNTLPASPDSAEVAEGTLVLRGMSILQNLLYRQDQTSNATTAAPLTSIVAEGKAHGMTVRQLARAVGLSDVILGKFDRRLIRFASIPREAVEAVAAAIQSDTERVVRYLQQGPTFAPATQHRSEHAPTLKEEDFSTAVRNDPTMTTEQRAHWLARAPRDQG